MEHRGASPLLLALALLSALCWRARALPPRGAAFPPVPRLGNRMPFDGASEPDHAHGSLKSESGILQNTLPENEKFYFDLSRIIDSSQESPVKRHSDAVFTDNYSRFRKQMAVKKYLNSVLTGKRSQEELNPAKLRDEAELLEPSFSENYDAVDELLSHLPLVCPDFLSSCYLLLDWTHKMRLIIHELWSIRKAESSRKEPCSVKRCMFL
ncbi:VIP peptides isoform 2-T2 [Morphnus guianensis]